MIVQLISNPTFRLDTDATEHVAVGDILRRATRWHYGWNAVDGDARGHKALVDFAGTSNGHGHGDVSAARLLAAADWCRLAIAHYLREADEFAEYPDSISAALAADKRVAVQNLTEARLVLDGILAVVAHPSPVVIAFPDPEDAAAAELAMT